MYIKDWLEHLKGRGLFEDLDIDNYLTNSMEQSPS
jgi:hypothetical protein